MDIPARSAGSRVMLRSSSRTIWRRSRVSWNFATVLSQGRARIDAGAQAFEGVVVDVRGVHFEPRPPAGAVVLVQHGGQAHRFLSGGTADAPAAQLPSRRGESPDHSVAQEPELGGLPEEVGLADRHGVDESPPRRRVEGQVGGETRGRDSRGMGLSDQHPFEMRPIGGRRSQSGERFQVVHRLVDEALIHDSRPHPGAPPGSAAGPGRGRPRRARRRPSACRR